MTATFYGDDRYADRLEDPGPAGRAEGAARSRSAPGRGRTPSIRAASRPRTGSPATSSRCCPSSASRRTTGPRPAPRRRPDGRPAAAPAAADPVPAGRHARAARCLHQPAPGLSGVHGRERRDPARRPGIGLTAPRIVTERTIAQLERMLAIPIDEAIVPSMVKVASRRPTASASAMSSAKTSTRPTRRSSTRCAASTCAASREEPGLWSAPDGEALYRTAIRSWTTLDLDPAGGPPDRPRRARVDRGGAPRDRRGPRLRRRHRGAIGPRSMPTSRTRPRTKDELVARANEDIERAMAAAPR